MEITVRVYIIIWEEIKVEIKVYFENCHPALFTVARIQNIS